MKYHAKFDKGHKEIGAEFRKLGWPHKDVARHAGLGCDYITKHRDGFPIFLELKRPGPPSSRKLTESEEALRSLFPDFFRVAQDWPEVLRVLGLA